MKANAKSHTHCQVARKASRTSQNLSKSMPLPTLQAGRKIKNEMATMYIVHTFLSSGTTPYTRRCKAFQKKTVWIEISKNFHLLEY